MLVKTAESSSSRSKPLFSVVTVCLNPGSGLLKAADSVLGQGSVDLEWVVKDGISTDGSVARCPKDRRVIIVSQQDAGIFDAMNQALEHCHGEYVHFLNVGDAFCGSQALERVAEGIHQHDRPALLYTYYEYARAGNVLKYPAQLTPSYLYRRSVCHQATFIRRDCYTRFGGFDPSLRVGADDELLARLILKERVSHARLPFASVRVEPWNFSARPENRGVEEKSRQLIRQKYLTPAQRLNAWLFYAATLPGLRRRWISQPAESRGYRIYVRLSNFVNQNL